MPEHIRSFYGYTDDDGVQMIGERASCYDFDAARNIELGTQHNVRPAPRA